MIKQLTEFIETTNRRVIGQKIKSAPYRNLYDWVMLESSELENSTIQERVNYILQGKPNRHCKNNQLRKFVPATQQYGYCGSPTKCACFRELCMENAKKIDQASASQSRKQTWINNYGVDNPSLVPAIVEQTKVTKSTRSYVESRKQFSQYKESIGFAQVIDRVKDVVTPNFTRDEYNGSFRKNFYSWKCVTCNSDFDDHIDYGRYPRCQVCYPPTTSTGQQELTDWIVSMGFEVDTLNRTILGKQELDIVIPALNIAIEFNGVYWHSDKFKDNQYHVNKLLSCQEKNIHLIHIYEDQWVHKQDIVKSRLASYLGISPRTFARKLKVRELSVEEYTDFVNRTHLQGYAHAKIKLGLVDSNDCIHAVMSFGVSRYTKDEYELIRYCSIGTVVGGSSKLFAWFRKQYNPTTVVSYANRCWSQGNLYKQLGFVDVTDNIANWGFWYVKGANRYHRSSFTKARLVQLGEDPALSADEIMKKNGYHKLYDCGNLKFKWSS